MQEHGDRQWSDTTGHGRQRSSHVRHTRMDVANDKRATFGEGRAPRRVGRKEAFYFGSVGDAVDADVHYGRARLHPIRLDVRRPSNRGNDDVGPRDDAGRSFVRE